LHKAFRGGQLKYEYADRTDSKLKQHPKPESL